MPSGGPVAAGGLMAGAADILGVSVGAAGASVVFASDMVNKYSIRVRVVSVAFCGFLFSFQKG